MHNLLTVKETSEYLRIPLPTVSYQRLSQQRDARSDFEKRADYGFEKAAAGGPAAPTVRILGHKEIAKAA